MNAFRKFICDAIILHYNRKSAVLQVIPVNFPGLCGRTDTGCVRHNPGNIRRSAGSSAARPDKPDFFPAGENARIISGCVATPFKIC